SVKVTGPTGVEMEALTAVAVACLTIYDMVKALERGMRIEGIRLLEKRGGKSGHYQAKGRTVALMPVAEPLSRVLADAEPLAAGPTHASEADGRALAADDAAVRTQPPGDVSAMDGYAVRSADVARVPVKLKLIGEVAAGHPFQGTVGAGEAARIFTGGVLPPGADAIVIQENTLREGDAVVITAPSSKGKHVRVEGLDFKRGAVLLARGHRLTDRDLALAAAMNHPTVPVHRRPKVAVLATGDELVMPGATLGFGEIVYSNGYATMALARREG